MRKNFIMSAFQTGALVILVLTIVFLVFIFTLWW